MTERVSTTESLEEISDRAHDILQGVLKASGREEELMGAGQCGGYYGLFSPSENAMVCYLPLGYIPPDKELGRHEKCREKANRLYNHPASSRSYDSRNPEEGMYGGAVRGRQFIHSFSGLPEALDEVFCCLYAIDVGDMTPEEAVTILGKETFEQYAPILH